METLSSLDLTRPDYSRQSEYGPYTPCAFHERSVDSEENQKRVLKQTERHFKNQSAKPEACMLTRGGSNPKRRQSLTNPHAEQQYVALLWPALCLYFAPLHPKAQPPLVPLPRHHDAGKMIDTHELPLAHQLPRSLHPLPRTLVFLRPRGPEPRAGVLTRSGPHHLRTPAPHTASSFRHKPPCCWFTVRLD